MRKKEVEKDVLTLARERIAHTYDRFDHVVVSFSGGKDSTVVLNLTLEEARRRKKLPLDVVFWDEEAQAPDTIDYMTRVQHLPDVALRWHCMPIKHRNACSRRSPYWYPWAPEDKAKWCRPLPDGAITEIPGFKRLPIPDLNSMFAHPSQGQTAIVGGIRAAESLRRFRAVTFRVYENYISIDSRAPWIYQVKPIYDWTTEDVWSAPRRFGWDYNLAYDVMTRAGISRHVQRVCPPYGEEPLQNLWMYSVCWPELWDKMSVRVPGAATAARYSRSPLYAFGSLPVKNPNESWEQLITLALQKWNEDQAAAIATTIRNFIKIHNKHTQGAEITDEPHEVSGVGWKMLYMIAIRGDLKGRKNRRLTTGHVAPEEAAS